MDITDHKRQEAAIDRLAHFDELTGAANRRRFYEEAQRVLKLAGRSASTFSLLTSVWTTSRASTTATVTPAATRSSGTSARGSRA